MLGQLPLGRRDGLHAPPGDGELRRADAARQLGVQHHRQLPSLEQDGPPVRVAALAALAGDDALQRRGGLVEAALVRQRHRPPVIDARLHVGPLARHQSEQPVRLGQVFGLGFAGQQ